MKIRAIDERIAENCRNKKKENAKENCLVKKQG